MFSVASLKTDERAVLFDAVRQCRIHLIVAAGFSALVNLLYLTPTLFMMQVYDRVVPTAGLDTLILISMMAVAALSTLATLDWLRSRLLARAGLIIERSLSRPIILRRLGPGTSGIGNLRDVDAVKTALSGQGVLAPELEVRLTRIELFPVTTERPDREVDVGVSIVRMQGEDIGMTITEQGVREGPRGIVDPAGIDARRHAQNDRQGNGGILSGRQHIQFGAPVLGQGADLRPSGQTLAVGSLQDQFSVSGDVVQVALQMAAVPRSSGDLDHHLRDATRDALKRGVRRLASPPSRDAQDRVRQPRPPHADGRTQRLFESERDAKIVHGSGDQYDRLPAKASLTPIRCARISPA